MRRTLALLLAAVSVGAAIPAVAQTATEQRRFDDAQARFDREYQLFRQEMERYRATMRGGYRAPDYRDDRYDANRYDDAGSYDPARDYRSGGQYRERVLGNDERIYRGSDGRYYCRRSDGTTGLIITGGNGNSNSGIGGILGNVLGTGQSGILGSVLGGLGNLGNRDRQQFRCR